MTIGYTGMNPFMYSMNTDLVMDSPILSAGIGMGGAGYGMGYGMGVGMMNPQSMMTNIQQWDDFGVNRQVAAFKNQNNAQFQMQAQNGSIERQVRILAQQIKANNQDNVKTEYNKLLKAVEVAYGSQIQGSSEEEKLLTLKQYADQIYSQYTGSYIADDIQANGRSAFGDGFMKIFSFGFGNKTSAAENIEMVTGVKRTGSAKAGSVFGKIIGTICTAGLGWLGQ